jgi:predicted permease
MTLFFSLLAKLFPLYLTMGAGAALGKVMGKLAGDLALIQIYLIAPVIVLASMIDLKFDAEIGALPFIFFGIRALISIITNFVARRAGSEYAPLLAEASGAMNAGYLGIPVAMALFPSDWIAPYIFVVGTGAFYDATLDYYWIARGRFSVREALKSLSRFPVLYAILAGIVLNTLEIKLPEMWQGFVRDFMGAYVVLGALIIGVALVQAQRIVFNVRLLSVLLGIKFLVWPALTFALVWGLRALSFGLPAYGEQILLLLSILPMAANTAALAALMRFKAEEAATAVALSTFLSLFIVPAYALLFHLGA